MEVYRSKSEDGSRDFVAYDDQCPYCETKRLRVHHVEICQNCGYKCCPSSDSPFSYDKHGSQLCKGCGGYRRGEIIEKYESGWKERDYWT